MLRPLLARVIVCLAFSGCFPYYGLQDSADTAGTGVGTSIVLADAHPGWQNPVCLGCHQTDIHNEGLVPYQCAACHGTNGAPAGHAGPAPCSDCHGTPHGSDGFPDPKACLVCHPE
jgi:hypothetical protein